MWKKLFGTKLSADSVVEQWHTLIPGAQGKGDIIYKKTVEFIEELDVPNVSCAQRMVKPDDVGLTGSKKNFLIVENTKLKNYDTYINVNDFGKQLMVSWYVVQEKPGLALSFRQSPLRTILALPFILFSNALSAVVSLGSRFSSSFAAGASAFGPVSPLGFIGGLNLFDQQELSAYVSTVHGAVTASVEELSKGINFDFSKVDTRTKGFLNIS